MQLEKFLFNGNLEKGPCTGPLEEKKRNFERQKLKIYYDTIMIWKKRKRTSILTTLLDFPFSKRVVKIPKTVTILDKSQQFKTTKGILGMFPTYFAKEIDSRVQTFCYVQFFC